MKKMSVFIVLILSALFFKCSSHKEEASSTKKITTDNSWQNFDYGSISLSYPDSWQIFNDSINHKVNLYKKSKTDTTLFEYDISMTPSPKYYLEKQSSFDQYVQKQIDQIKELYAITIQSKEEHPVNSKKSYQYTGQYLSDSGVNETVHLYFIEGSYEDLIIFSTGGNASASEAEKIIQTINIK